MFFIHSSDAVFSQKGKQNVHWKALCSRHEGLKVVLSVMRIDKSLGNYNSMMNNYQCTLVTQNILAPRYYLDTVWILEPSLWINTAAILLLMLRPERYIEAITGSNLATKLTDLNIRLSNVSQVNTFQHIVTECELKQTGEGIPVKLNMNNLH